jgi:hypothetical protein
MKKYNIKILKGNIFQIKFYFYFFIIRLVSMTKKYLLQYFLFLFYIMPCHSQYIQYHTRITFVTSNHYMNQSIKTRGLKFKTLHWDGALEQSFYVFNFFNNKGMGNLNKWFKLFLFTRIVMYDLSNGQTILINFTSMILK